ncbi:hypothetical protein FACS189498_0150 [Spirochaetia bacterium]|jgi:hypothetical protein|nr:hypothetical protein [Reyranella sp.]GHV24039.1 hypothetical protein FACS189498_0150 [Spirochaetia bacterium]
MLKLNRRTVLKIMAGSALTAPALTSLPLPAAAEEDLVVSNRHQNFKRGTIDSLHPERRIFNIVWEDLGRVKMRAADLVTNYPQLKIGNVVDVQWYDYLDFMIAPKSPQAEAAAFAMLVKGARLEGIPGMQEPIRLWRMDGMVTRADPAASTIYIINASAGLPEEPSPDSGEVIQMPPIRSAAGLAAMRSVKPGDELITVWSQQTAIKATVVR